MVFKADLCVIKSERLSTREKDKLFMNGLPSWMRTEMTKLGDENFEKKIEIITNLEEQRESHGHIEKKR